MGKFMEYEEFKTAVKRDLPVYLPLNLRNRQIGEQTVYKVNQKLDGVHLIPKEQPVGMERETEKKKGDDKVAAVPMPSIYFEDFYQMLLKGNSYDKVLNVMGDLLSETKMPKELPAKMTDFAECKERILPELINYEKNQEYLKNLPHRRYLDLAVIYRIVYEVHQDRFGIIITNALAEEIKMGEEQLYKAAMLNAFQNKEVQIIVLCENLCAVTNQKHYLGATTLLLPWIFEEKAKELDSDLYLLPSSIHEIMVVPTKGWKLGDMQELVAAANRDCVEIQDWLSDQVYLYRKDTGIIEQTSLQKLN